MNIMHRKKVTLLAALTTTTMAVVMAVVFASNGMDLYSVRGQGEVVNGSITWNTSSQKTKHQNNRISYHSKTNGGMDLVMYTNGQYNASNDYVFSSKKSDYQEFGIWFVSQEASTTLFQFQSITSVSITTASTSQSGASFAVYTDSTASGSAVKTQTVSNAEETYTITTEVSGAHYLAIKPNSTTYSVDIKSVTVNYSCEPGGGDEPVVDEYSISYYSQDGYDLVPLEGIDESSLVSKAEEGSTVEITPVALSGYEYLGSYEVTEYISDYSESAGVISFTMPSHNIEICLVTQSTAVTLSSISVSGYTTEFSVGDTFAFGGTVTAHYSDSSSANVTASATFSGYDMSTAGNQTVIVSYTEGGVNRTTAYSITVTSQSTDVVLEGLYEYTSRSEHESPSWVGKMTIEFYSNNTVMWRNVRGLSGNYDCKVYFTYVATNNGANISIVMTGASYDFKVNGQTSTSASSWSGGTTDRPCNGFSGGGNDSGVMTLDRSSLTIEVLEYYSSSYHHYDTFTFTLAS